VPFIRVPLTRPDLPLAIEVTKDLIGRFVLRRPHRMVPVAGPVGTAAAMTSDGAEQWMANMAASAPTFRNEVTTSSLLAMTAWSTAAAARKIKVPLFVVLAEDDTITPPAMVHKALAATSGVEYLTFPQTHFELLTTYYLQVRTAIVEWFVKTLA
jgi:uncharacterized protein